MVDFDGVSYPAANLMALQRQERSRRKKKREQNQGHTHWRSGAPLAKTKDPNTGLRIPYGFLLRRDLLRRFLLDAAHQALLDSSLLYSLLRSQLQVRILMFINPSVAWCERKRAARYGSEWILCMLQLRHCRSTLGCRYLLFLAHC
jgi:hypothetical protein